MSASDLQNGAATPTNVPRTAAQPNERAKAGTRLSYSRSRPLGRPSPRFNPSASNDHSPSATVGIPIPPTASSVVTTATTAAPKADGGKGSLRQSGAPRKTAASQLIPRISQRTKRSPSNGLSRPRITTSAQPAPDAATSHASRRGGAASPLSSSSARRSAPPNRSACPFRGPSASEAPGRSSPVPSAREWPSKIQTP